jgi:cysteinyl-tRNA synthetase
MTVRFFILQAQYRSTLDFSNEALIAANKGYKKIANGLKIIKSFSYQPSSLDVKLIEEVNKLSDSCYEGLNDDFNTASTIASLFNLLKKINSFYTKTIDLGGLDEASFNKMKDTYINLVENVLGLNEESVTDPETLINGLLELYKNAKEKKEYDKVDQIRSFFKKEGLVIKDMKHGVDWAYEE